MMQLKYILEYIKFLKKNNVDNKGLAKEKKIIKSHPRTIVLHQQWTEKYWKRKIRCFCGEKYKIKSFRHHTLESKRD